MKRIKYGIGFCRCLTKEVEISYLHITTTTHRETLDALYAEAMISYTCLEKSTCLQKNCAQNNCFGEKYLEVHE